MTSVVYVLLVMQHEGDEWGELDRADHPDAFGRKYPGLSTVYWDWKVYRETTTVVRELAAWRPTGDWDAFKPSI